MLSLGLMLSLTLELSVPQAATSPKAIVFEVQDHSGQGTPARIERLTRALRENLERSHRFEVVSSASLNRALQSASRARCSYPLCHVRMLRQMKADRGLSTLIFESEGRCAVVLRLIDERLLSRGAEGAAKTDCSTSAVESAAVGALKKMLKGASVPPSRVSSRALEREAARWAAKGRCKEALEVAKRCVAAEARADCYRTMGVCYAKQKEDKRALQSYRKYLELAPNAPDAAQIRAMIGGGRRN